jgi:hypothetical protein
VLIKLLVCSRTPECFESSESTLFVYQQQHIQAPVLTCALVAFMQIPRADWILNADMFKGAMSSANIDVKKMPLGSISQAQVAT